jgi:hypothetical protein
MAIPDTISALTCEAYPIPSYRHHCLLFRSSAVELVWGCHDLLAQTEMNLL